MKEVARRIQEVWEEEGVDLSSLATWPRQGGGDADTFMRAVYRKRKNLPEEMLCEYCGGHVEILKATEGKYCNPECAALSADFRRRHANG
jgi:hypothetical protein